MIFKVLQLPPSLYVWKCCSLTKVPFLSPSCAVLMPPVYAHLAAIGLAQWFISHLFAVWKALHRCWMLCFPLLIALTHEAVKHMLMDQIKINITHLNSYQAYQMKSTCKCLLCSVVLVPTCHPGGFLYLQNSWSLEKLQSQPICAPWNKTHPPRKP